MNEKITITQEEFYEEALKVAQEISKEFTFEDSCIIMKILGNFTSGLYYSLTDKENK